MNEKESINTFGINLMPNGKSEKVVRPTITSHNSYIENLVQKENDLLNAQRQALLNKESRIPGKAYFKDGREI